MQPMDAGVKPVKRVCPAINVSAATGAAHKQADRQADMESHFCMSAMDPTVSCITRHWCCHGDGAQL